MCVYEYMIIMIYLKTECTKGKAVQGCVVTLGLSL